jgi:uncharacterized SAM-binding protein YcdF (DUF218 family)
MMSLARVSCRRWPLRLLVVAGLLLAAYLARGQLLPAAARFLDVSQPPRHVDDVMVLGGGYTNRPFVAAALLRAGLAHRALIPTASRPPDDDGGPALAEHEIVRRVLIARGVPDEAIVTLPGEVTSTRDEARALHRFLESHTDATVAVVTNGFHTRRARMLFRHELGGYMDRLFFVAAPMDEFDSDNWWRHEGGVSCYATEYFKLVYYGLREDRTWQGGALAVASVVGAACLLARRRRMARNNSERLPHDAIGSAAPDYR